MVKPWPATAAGHASISPLTTTNAAQQVQQVQQVTPLALSLQSPSAAQQVTPLPLSSQPPNAAQQVTPLPLSSKPLKHLQPQPPNDQQQAHSASSCNFMQQYHPPPLPQCSSNDSTFLMDDDMLSITSDQLGIPISTHERTPEPEHSFKLQINLLAAPQGQKIRKEIEAELVHGSGQC